MTVGISTVNAANKFLDLLFRQQAWTAPAGFFVKWHVSDPGAAGANGAANVTTRSAATFSAAASGAVALSNTPTYTATSSEMLTHVSFWDASTAGNFLGSAVLTSSRAVVATDVYNLTSLSASVTPLAA